MSRRASQQSKILLPVLQFISTLRRTIKKDRKKPATRALKTEESQNPPPEKRSKVGFSSHPIENKHVTSKWPSKTKDLRKIGFRQISKQRTYVRPYQ
jgi:hypothetical protein